MLQITDLTYRIAGRLLLDRASLALPAGHHAGLVGRNGTGKSTLLKIIAGDLHGESGSIDLPRNTRIGMVAQEAPDGPESLLDTYAYDGGGHELKEMGVIFAEHLTGQQARIELMLALGLAGQDVRRLIEQGP